FCIHYFIFPSKMQGKKQPDSPAGIRLFRSVFKNGMKKFSAQSGVFLLRAAEASGLRTVFVFRPRRLQFQYTRSFLKNKAAK
ncbi:MAG: hypothetical protein IKW76_12590, partial [Clostridia bacterium]|nr:hypothetical protein [Clostridia bacterium]